MWIKIESEVQSNGLLKVLRKLDPVKESLSLHCWEEEYQLLEDKYKISGSFHTGDVTVEYWRD